MSDTDVAETSLDAYRELVEEGEDVSLRRQVVAKLAEEPMTADELAREFPERSANSIRPRVTELLRMGCVKREGKRENPSGHEAYVHHVTETGHRYLRGEDVPEPGPTLSEHKAKVVDIARQVVRGNADTEILDLAVRKHDEAKRRRDPEWDGGL